MVRARREGRFEGKGKRRAWVIDSNVIIASALGKATLAFLLSIEEPMYVPSMLEDELRKHVRELARRKGIPVDELWGIFEDILSLTKVITVEKTYLEEGINYVYDPGDAPFAGLAIFLRKTFPEVIILTYNTKDYKKDFLQRRNIRVLRPFLLKSL